MKTLIFLILLSFQLGSCKRNYTCECVNPGGVYATHTIKGTTGQAKKECDKLNGEANQVPWSESVCRLK